MKNLRIYVAGHNGMVGSALVRILKKYHDVITKNKLELDLTNQNNVNSFLKSEKIDQIYIAAAKVGGIHANDTYPAEFIYENLMIQSNIIHSAFLNGIKKLLFLGSSCIYPKFSKQPMSENDLLTGKLESTNEPYAIAKIAGIKMCESYNRQYNKSHGTDFRCIMPTNLYGPGDNYHPENSHVIPALIQRFHKAKINKHPYVDIWGSGKSRREFLYVDEMASAAVHIMNLNKKILDKFTGKMCSHINVGSGFDITVEELAKIVKKVVGYNGLIKYDLTKPEGSPKKLLNSKLINDLGWFSELKLEKGLAKTYEDFKLNNANI
jgi:GDP-L-fucose synthase